MTKRVGQLLSRGLLWGIGIYKIDGLFDFDMDLLRAHSIFSNKKIRVEKEKVHTLADPFLFVKNGFLYLFYESQSVRKSGLIKAYRADDLKNFEDLGVILKEDFHLSYPFVFEVNDNVFMMPDCSEIHEIRVYKFENFPYAPTVNKVLLRGYYLDPSLVEIDGIWYLFATSEQGLEIHFTDDLFNTPLRPHPLNPISTDPRYKRCGGGIISVKGNYYRLAQDCSEEYGKNLNIFKIETLDPQYYKENLVRADFLQDAESWNYLGGHHLSHVLFNGKSVIATDGKHQDYFVNKLGTLFHRVKAQLNL